MPKSLTQDVVIQYLKYVETGKHHCNWMRTFTHFANIFSGVRLNSKSNFAFWNSIAFYNYVQYPTTKTRLSPSNEDFIKSLEAFKESLKPDLIIFWGDRLWNNFPKENHKQINRDETKIHYLDYQRKIPFKVIPHPASSKLSYSHTNEIKDYIKLVKSITL